LYLAFTTDRMAADAKKAFTDQLDEARSTLHASARPWILIPGTPEVVSITHRAEGLSITLGIVYKQSGQSPAGNGQVAAFILPSISLPETEFVKTTQVHPDCPLDVGANGWIPFNPFSSDAQEISAVNRDAAVERQPYVLICARYEWALDRAYGGRVVMLYRLNGTMANPALQLRASYAG
jgi:hypothetical protein